MSINSLLQLFKPSINSHTNKTFPSINSHAVKTPMQSILVLVISIAVAFQWNNILKHTIYIDQPFSCNYHIFFQFFFLLYFVIFQLLQLIKELLDLGLYQMLNDLNCFPQKSVLKSQLIYHQISSYTFIFGCIYNDGYKWEFKEVLIANTVNDKIDTTHHSFPITLHYSTLSKTLLLFYESQSFHLTDACIK